MRSSVPNALVVGGCALSLAMAHTAEQHRHVDVTSPQATYTAGTIVMQSHDGYVAGPPNGPVDPIGYRVIESR